LFDPHSKSVILGVSRYRDAPTGEVRWFEAGSDPDSVFHELGHVVVSLALPHADIFDLTVKEYSESYGHTLAMVMPLRDRAYVAAFLTAAGGDWSTPNPVSQLALAPPASPDGSTPVATSDAVGHNYFQHPEAAPYARAAQDLNVNYALLQGFTAQFQAAGHGAIEAVQRAGDLIARLRTLALFDHMGQVRFDPSAERGIVALFKAASRVLDDGQHSVLLDTLMKFVGEEVVGKAVDQLQQYERALPSWTLPPDWKEPGAMKAFLNAHSRDLNLPEGFSLDFLTSEQRTDGTVRVLGQMRYGDTLTANVAALVWSGTDGRLLDAHPAVDEPVASSPAIRALAAFKPKFEPEVPASMPFLVGTWGIRVEHAQPIPTAVSKLPIHHRRIAFVGK
ncbi:MAG: hypothetical protein ACKVPX_10745, partial [Myxococcaceae bacterium]